ncbi:MAG: adenylate kinase [Okeania sp. SIO2F4]|uniref:adenylate kinase n=1 Tax=Okeania sp. SIO2F4 TaxID=2607790 RepID=UPI00142A29BB|nr:adenylate kinase [Okeania sp. SIO2F4]NES03473.1 adenylate kinase [Okeania sp. SIO2F4]
MRLIILGGPGAGKGTQAELLCQYLQIPLISIGNILREAIATQTTLGQVAQAYVEKGDLVPDRTMIEFVRQRLLESDVTQGWLMDGYPRTAFQAEELHFLLDDLGQKLDWAIYLKVSEEESMNRCLKRGRTDDNPEIVQRRVDLFYERTIPILEYYQYRQKLLTIDGGKTVTQVQQEILQKLNSQ